MTFGGVEAYTAQTPYGDDTLGTLGNSDLEHR